MTFLCLYRNSEFSVIYLYLALLQDMAQKITESCMNSLCTCYIRHYIIQCHSSWKYNISCHTIFKFCFLYTVELPFKVCLGGQAFYTLIWEKCFMGIVFKWCRKLLPCLQKYYVLCPLNLHSVMFFLNPFYIFICIVWDKTKNLKNKLKLGYYRRHSMSPFFFQHCAWWP